jgi:hypothetical protein
MTRFQVLGAATLALMMVAPDATAQAVRGGMRGAVVGGLVGGQGGAATGAKIGAVAGAARTVGAEAAARAQYQATPAYQNAPRSNFTQAPPQVLVTAPAVAAPAPPAAAPAPPAAAPAPPAAAPTTGVEAVIRKDGKPVVEVTYPADWKETTGANYVSAVSSDGQAYSMVAILEGATDKPGGITWVKQVLPQYLQDIKFDDQTESKRGALVVTGTAKGKKTGIDVVFAVGVMDTGEGQVAGAAFVVDANIEDHYKETIRHICETIRVGNDITEKK